MILAQVAPTEIAAWLMAAFAIAGGVNQVMKIVDRVKDKPAPGEVMRDSVERFTTKTEFHAHVAEDKQEHANLWRKVGGVERGSAERMDAISREWREFVDVKVNQIMESSDHGREKLHDRINDVLGEVRELRGRMEGRGQ